MAGAQGGAGAQAGGEDDVAPPLSEPAWPAGAATGVGSLPYDDPLEAVRVVAGELGDLPHLPECPARGPGADMIGRTAALLVDLAVDLQPSGWRLVPRAGGDLARARDYFRTDLDALEAMLGAHRGWLKVQVTGPWTLAASLETRRGSRALADGGAVRDLVDSLAEGVALHVREVRRRLPHATVVVQLDEPSLPAVRAGSIPTASGLGRINPVPDGDAADALRAVAAATDAPVGMHCCADDSPLDLVAAARLAFVSVPLPGPGAYDALAALADAGVQLLLGAVPTTPPIGEPESVLDAAAPLRRLWRDVGFPADTLASRVTVTPECGLAGATPDYALAALTRCREIGRSLLDAADVA